MTNRLLIGLYWLLILYFKPITTGQLTLLTKAEELKQIQKLKIEIDFMKKNVENFYNYTIVCGGKTYESRADQTFSDKTIPVQFKNFVLETFLKPENRANKCPKWSYNVETHPRSGGMDSLSIPENTKPGQKVYLLLAIDPDSEPIFYFFRRAESETGPNDDPDDIIFKVNIIKMGDAWIGEVILDKELDYEKKQSYNYLTYAYDGSNLLEKYSTIEITDVDDEKPEIKIDHPNYNSSTKQFEFQVFENVSIGEIINSNARIFFNDTDTQSSQLVIRLTNFESGIADSPFNVNNNGELRLISSLDYETQPEYLLKLNVKDMSGGFSEEIIKIEVLDVPDLSPKFIEPKNMMIDSDRKSFKPSIFASRQFENLKDEGYVVFYENKIGPVFNILGVSANNEPLGKIRYELIEDFMQMKGYFELRKHTKNDTWYLDCIKEISLDDKEEEFIQFTIRAIESSETNPHKTLFTDKKVTVKIINGDMCLPTFDKPLYEFEVVENVKQLLEPIYVSDCDHGINGKINLTTTNKDFSFKLDQVYRYSKLGIYMAKSYDYEQNLTIDGHIIEFEIIARGSENSLNKYETRSVVRIKILDINEFIPRFVLPTPAYFLKDGIPTEQQQRIFLYNVPEGQDFVLDVKAEDQDKGGDGELFYFCRYLHPDDSFEIIHSYNSTSKLFNIRIPGRYFDSTSRIPITFAVYVEDSHDELRLKNEIIINLKAVSAEQHSAYFEFPHYEFKLKENSEQLQTFRFKLINENLNASKILLEEISDPLNLFSPEFEENWINKKDIISLVENDASPNDPEQDVNSDLFVILYPTNSTRDFDQLFIDNNSSDIYEYKLRVRLIERADLFNDVTVQFKLIDSNDNPPELVNLKLDNNEYLNATLVKTFVQNTLININDSHFIPKVQDLDFSDEFGLKSLYCRVNDTRFYMDNEYMSAELERRTSSVSMLVRVLTNPDNIHKEIIWLNITCEDNYFNRKSKFNTINFLIRLSVVESEIDFEMQIFDKDQYVFEVEENWTGVVGKIGNFEEKKNLLSYKIESYSHEQSDFLNQLFYMEKNQLVLRQKLDFEGTDKMFNFTVVATVSSFKSKTDVVILVTDLNDETPKMSQNELNIVLSQNHKSKGTQIGNLYAIDKDKEDSLLGLNFKSTSDKFKFEKLKTTDAFLHGISIILADDLNDDQQFEIIVTDNNSHSDKCKVSVSIKNEQVYDEIKWSKDTYEASIDENSPVNTFVAKVNVDPIGLKTTKSKIGYKIINENRYFKIDENSGEIRTSNFNLDREEKNFVEPILFVQAYLTIDSTTYWSTMTTVKINVNDLNDEHPIFVQPSNNQTQIAKFKPDSIFTFKAIDSDKNDNITYKLLEQSLVSPNLIVNLPFKLEPDTGVLSFNITNLSNDDYMTLLKHESEYVRVKVTVQAVDSSQKTSTSTLLVDLSINKLLRQSNEVVHLTPIVYKLEPKTETLNKLNDSDYIIDESTQPNTIIAELSSYISDHKIPLSESFKILSSNDTIRSPELYFKYDYATSYLKLIRKLDFDLVKNVSLALVSDDDFTIEFNFKVNDTNDKAPELELDDQEMDKYGENLIIVSVNNLTNYTNSMSRAISSTSSPQRKPVPAMPEMGLPERPIDFMPQNTKEYDQNLNLLEDFDRIKLVKAYKISDSDKHNNFSVRFDSNGTSEAVARSYAISTNGTHVLIEKIETRPEDEAILEENLHNRFKIELSDGKNVNHFSGELYRIDARQLQRLSNYVPKNGRFKSSLYRSSLANTKINLEPVIQIENPFPYDIHVELEGKYGKLFNIAPRVIRSSSVVNFGPTELIISLKDSMEDHDDELSTVTSIDFSVNLMTKNDYLNVLLRTIGSLKVKLDLKNENKFQPKIQSIEPSDRKIVLDEGTYNKKQIAKIEAYDNDRGDPGRLEYFLIGNSNLLEINSTTGEVYLNGTLDAESEQLIVFFCYARDLAPAPLGRNSELQRFEITVNDINEFKPIIQPVRSSLSLKEVSADFDQEEKIIDEFQFDCYDRDFEPKLDIVLNSIQYVSRHDVDNVIEVPKSYQLKDLFRLVYENSTNNNYKSAHLAYTNKLDYEKLYRPNETLIRIDVACSDGNQQSLSKLTVKIEDLNDNAPIFINKTMEVHKNESNLLETIVRVQASDNDLSAQYGNQSLKYKIIKCAPNTFEIYIDERTGDISSRLLLDLDTDEVIEKRKQIHNNQLNFTEQFDFMTKYNRIECQISVQDAGLYGTPSNASLMDTMNLTIIINNMNDNPPDIRLDKQSDNLIEIKEGEQTLGAILQKISVYDKDGASGLECLFGNGFKTSDPFELRTSLDVNDPHICWCVLKVRDDMIVDYDIYKKSIYLLEIVVNDKDPLPVYPNKGVSRAQIRIRVIPVNNKPPMFVNGNEETFNVLDTVRPGTIIGTVLATDMENPNPDRLNYDFDKLMTSDRVRKKFKLERKSSTGSYWGSINIQTIDKLEVSESPYIFSIIAYDGPVELKDTLSSRKIIKINVLNKGSMSVWVNETSGLPADYYSVNLEEEVPLNTEVLRVRAKIPDQNMDSNEVLYSLVSDGNTTNPFYSIDANSGVIRTIERIDYELINDLILTNQMRNLKVRASSADGLFTYTTLVSINILDVNDNKPKFESVNYKFCVVENSTDISTVGFVKAIDLDSGLNGLVKYKLTNGMDLFQINQVTGELRTLSPEKIDRETNSSLKVEIVAFDSDDLEDKLELEICVLDINDNWPVFDNELKNDYEIYENSNELKIELKATDADYSLNGSVYFYFDKELNPIEITQKFRVEPLTGFVELLSPLDYETKQMYEMTITCSDNGIPNKLRTNFALKVKVLDLNDNAPEFSAKNPGRIYVNEGAKPGDILLKLDAIDKDITSEFKDIRYKIRSIQYLKSSSEYLTLGSELFVINSNGEILLGQEQKLDYQKFREYRVEIEAFDFNKPELSNLFTLSVNVEPSNDKIPIFEHFTGGSRHTTLYRRSLAESRDNDFVVDIVKAVDPNQHGIKYYLDSVIEYDANNNIKSRPNDLFSIGLDDGAVKTRKIRSFYSGDSYALNIRAASKLNESLSSSTNLIVKIDSESDSLFEQRVIEISIDENLSPRKLLIQLKPKVSNHTLKYKINANYSSPDDLYNKWFKVDFNTGIVQTNDKANIDCELADEVLLSVDVFNEADSLIENLLVRIRINDLNDNYPVFDQSYNYEPSIYEDNEMEVDIERVITKFKALDADRNENNSAISYRIESVKNMNLNSFRLDVDSSTGEVTLYKTKGTNLDRDSASIGSIVRVQVRAENTYKPSIYSQKEVLIHLLDLNDNPPSFYDSSPEQTLSLPEDHPLGDKFYQVKAYDSDEINNLNSQLVFEVIPRSSGVDIDSQGYLYLIRPLDYEDKKMLEFTVNVYDKSPKPLFASKIIKLNVENVNDNGPKFESLPNEDHNGECSFSLVENMEPKRLLQFTASDRDFVQNPLFEFKLIDLKSFDHKTRSQVFMDKSLFKLDSNTGELFLKGNLDREQYDNFILRVKLLDKEINGKQLETTVDCSIKILDVNDNSPQFSSNTPLQYKVLPLVNEKTLIGYFAASDLDLGLNSSIEYNLKDTKNNLFEIDSSSYLFINLKKFNYNKNHDLDDVYDLEISAKDLGVPQRLESTLKIRVQIDPNYFTFDQQKMDRLELTTPDEVTLIENSKPGTVIGYAKVLNSFSSVINEAKTTNQNRMVDLKFKLLTCNDTFKIDEKTGLIVVKDSTKLDYETIKEFVLQVEAVEVQQMSTYSKRRSGVSSFMIRLRNVNDNPPAFSQSIYETSVKENQKLFVNTLNLIIAVSDGDFDSSKTDAINQLNPVEVRLSGQDSSNFELLQMNKYVFNIKSLHAFDYEFQKRYEFNLTAWDGVYKSFAKVIVNVLDENDNQPRFEKDEYLFRIDENSPTGTEVGYVKAIDLDQSEENNQIFYHITNTQDNVFSIDSKTGLISVRDSFKLDRERIDSFNLTVKASNLGKTEFFDTVKVIIFLNDLNDETPIFVESQIQVNVREKLKVLPKYLTKVHAIDNDLEGNGTVTYSITSINNEPYDPENRIFFINKQTGDLFLDGYLKADSTDENRPYEILITAEDQGGKSERGLVIVNLIDINDQAPIVSSPELNEFIFEENSEIDKPLFEVKAYDPDHSQSKIIYSIDQDFHNDSQNFRIDPNTGYFYATKMFDYETKNEFNIKILCKDTGIMIDEEEGQSNGTVNDLKRSYKVELTTEYRIKIMIIDVDDNEPEFSNTELFKVNVSENLQEGSKVTILPIALDRDSLPDNTMVRYYFVDGDYLGKFILNEKTGEISLLKELERKEKNVYDLTIQATSRSLLNTTNPNQKSILHVQINVVQDKLFIEFDEQEYYVSAEIDNPETKANDSEKLYKVEDFASQQSTQISLNLDAVKKSAIFYSKSHLIKRKIRRDVTFNIEMLQIIRQNEKLKTKLPINLVSKINKNEVNNMIEALKFGERLFLINETNGKVYINREMLKKENYRAGDRFLLTISASSPSQYSDETENTLTELTVRLTDKNYSFIKRMNSNNLTEIMFESLNPLSVKYIPRILQADGVKIAIQDFISYKSELSGDTSYYLIMQVEARQEKQSLDLDLFMKIWKNYSPSSSGFFNEMNFIDPRPLTNARQVDHSDVFSIYRPFYSSWLFWLLFLIGCLLVLILLFFVFCIRQNHKQHKTTKKPGIIIEYPPGVNPIYNDGVLSLNNNSKPNSVKRKIVPVELSNSPQTVTSEDGYEEKEFKIDFDSEEEV